MAGRISYYGGIVRDGLILNLDAAKRDSYPKEGSVWHDLSEAGNDGTLKNGASFDDEVGSIAFDGSNDHIELGNTLNMGTGDMTISVFVNISSIKTYNAWIVSKAIAAGATYRFGLGLLANTNQARIFYCGSPIVDIIPYTTTALSIDTWYNICGVWNRNGDMQIFINGIEETLNGTKSISGYSSNNFVSTYPYRVASYTAANAIDVFNPIHGKVALVKHYNRALSSEEILQNYNALKGRFGL